MDNTVRIYLAAPYTHKRYEVRLARFKEVSRKAAELLWQGHLVFSPITHSHYLAERCGCQFTDEEWKHWYLSFLDHWATHLYVLQLPGWESSKGVNTEIKCAKELGLVISYESVLQ